MSHSLEHNSTDQQNASKGVEVFVGGLARTVTEDKVHKVFSTCGEILEMRMIKDPKGNLKGFGFVRFATKDAADRAIKELSGYTLEGKKIGVLPSAAQDTLFLGNLNKGWSTDDFSKVVLQVFPDVVSIDLAMPLSGGETTPGKKIKNRGFAFVKFSSHAAAARAYRAGSKPDFVLGGNLHPSVQWAEEDAEVDPSELAKIKIAFIRNLPPSSDENYLKRLFVPFGKIDKVVVSSKGQSSVGFVHFAQRSDLDKAIEKVSDKMVEGPNGGPSFKLQVEVARPLDKKRKRVREDPQNNQPSEILSQSKLRTYESAFNSSGGHEVTVKKETVVADPYEAAVLLLPAAVKERLLRILRLGIATRFDMDIQSLTSLAELPESTAIAVLDQFMLSGADKQNKGAYLAGLISRYQVDKLGINQLPSSLTRLGGTGVRESVSLSGRVHLEDVDSLASHVGTSVPRSDGYASRYALYSDYPVSVRAGVGRTKERSPVLLHELPESSTPHSRYGMNSRLVAAYRDMEETSPIRSHQIPGSSLPYGKGGLDSHRIPYSSLPYGKEGADPHQIPGSSLLYGRGGPESHLAASTDRQHTRPQMRFDPFTGQPYKFDPFTGEPIVPESLPRRYGSPY